MFGIGDVPPCISLVGSFDFKVAAHVIEASMFLSTWHF